MNSIILVDDDAQFIKAFISEAATNKITVAPQKSLDGLKKMLPAFAHKFAAVVLDIKCLLTDTQTKENADFIAAAIHYIDTTVPGFPRFILTGDDTEFDGLKKYYPKEKMFLKKPDGLQELIKELEYCISNAEPLRVRREHPLVFAAFDKGLLDAGKETLLLSILENYNEKNPSNFKGILGDIRELHEEIYKSINKRNKAVVPDQYINGNGSPTFTGAFYKHFLGNPDPTNNYKPSTIVYQDSTILEATKFIQQTCSEYLHNTSKTGYKISPYTIKSLINGLLELILWSKQY